MNATKIYYALIIFNISIQLIKKVEYLQINVKKKLLWHWLKLFISLQFFSIMNLVREGLLKNYIYRRTTLMYTCIICSSPNFYYCSILVFLTVFIVFVIVYFITMYFVRFTYNVCWQNYNTWIAYLKRNISL